jgi:hypothetical protein
MSTSSAPPTISLGNPPSDKLTRANYPGWRAQVLPPIRGACLVGLLDGSDAAPPEFLELSPPTKTSMMRPKQPQIPPTTTGFREIKLSLGTFNNPSPLKFLPMFIG